MSTAIRSRHLALVPPDARPAGSLPPGSPAVHARLELALADQQSLTAVERFAREHDDGLPAQAKYYRNLLPAAAPRPGQQYAFEVDLDLCTGCKACVTGCHNLNGLDDGEVWRTVGLLHGGTAQAPAQQTITTACHHCLEPACLTGCPVKAYDKDPVTGIVKHLDDQCIGCQYCIFMCPYDAPKMNKARGIVRKCDMCSDRLAHGEAPACVQSCPNEAIRITVVDRAEAVQASEANAFVPGAPAPGDTLPTTVYKTERALPRNMLPADFYSVTREHAHTPLAIMLVLTQLSVGAFVLGLLARAIMGPLGTRQLATVNALGALGLGIAALGAGTLHLGRPRYAFRAFLGLRTSWFSREILAFPLFASLAGAYAASFFVPGLPPSTTAALGYAGAGAGALFVLCSVMVYAATRRPHWRGSLTGFRFASTALLLGAATVLLISLAASAAAAASGAPTGFLITGAHRRLTYLLMGAAGLKLAVEASGLLHLRDRQHTVPKRMAILMTGELGRQTLARFACGALGALVMPAAALAVAGGAAAEGSPAPFAALVALAAASFVLCLAGELLERFLFFAAAPASKMPGGVG